MLATSICIPTYQRPELLKQLINDLTLQSMVVDRLIVVDADPDSGVVLRILKQVTCMHPWEVIYIPSNHANLPYQRYLGWKAAHGSAVLLYLDDDLRVLQFDAIEKLVAPFQWQDSRVVGVTARINMSHRHDDRQVATRLGAGASRPHVGKLVSYFGAANRVAPGGLSPSGHRRLPDFQGQDYEQVQWLHGGVMAYQRDALEQDCFSDGLFAMYALRWGKGEDTLLSRYVSFKGEMLLAFCVTIEHPNIDEPRAYPTKAFQLGHAIAYSRRLLNDNYRGPGHARLWDRFQLVKSYVGTSLLNWWGIFASFNSASRGYALGYSLGAVRGVIQKPTARNLTPNINWWADADRDMAQSRIIASRPPQRVSILLPPR